MYGYGTNRKILNKVKSYIFAQIALFYVTTSF